MYTYSISHKERGYLEKIRVNNGTDSLKVLFHDLANNNIEKAVNLINDKNLLFPSLFLLQSEIKRFDLYAHLNTRNKCALEISNEILNRRNSDSKQLSSYCNQEDYSTLKWILETGYMDDGINDQYDEVIEVAAIILVKTYKDKTCLDFLEQIIFNRYRRGLPIYDLVWAFFEISEPGSLILITKRLLSNDRKDIELARKLLNFIPDLNMNSETDNIRQYQNSLKWINENRQFLIYTGETFLQTNNPRQYIVSLEYKYLHKPVPLENGDISRSLSEADSRILEGFKQLDMESKLLLSNCSSVLYHRNINLWNKWLHYPMLKQIEIAKSVIGGLA